MLCIAEYPASPQKEMQDFFILSKIIFWRKSMRTLYFGQPVKGLCPTDSVSDYALNLGDEEGRIAFVTGLEIENSAKTLAPAAARTENLSALEPT